MRPSRLAAVTTFVVSVAFVCSVANSEDKKKPAVPPKANAPDVSKPASKPMDLRPKLKALSKDKKFREGSNIIHTDAKSGVVLSANFKASKIVGYTAKDKAGKPLQVKPASA